MALILVADDESDIRELISMCLESVGHDVVSVGSGTEALTELGTGRFDAVVIDNQMPGMTGLEVLRRSPPVGMERRPVVVMVSALGDRPVIEAALEAGATDYLVKPFPLATLVKRLDERLSRSFQPH